MAGVEDDARGPEIDVDGVRFSGFEEFFFFATLTEAGTDGAFAEIKGSSVRIDIAEARDEIGVRDVGGNPDLGANAARNFDRLSKCASAEDENVGTVFDFLLVHRARRNSELRAADCGHRV